MAKKMCTPHFIIVIHNLSLSVYIYIDTLEETHMQPEKVHSIRFHVYHFRVQRVYGALSKLTALSPSDLQVVAVHIVKLQ